MKTDKPLEEKLKDVETNLSGVRDQLKPYSNATWGLHWDRSPEDVEYLETDRYQIVVAKWEEHEWSESGGGIQWKEWLSLHYREKGSEGEIRQIKTDKIVLRDKHSASKDRRDLWPYNFVGVQPLSPTQVEVSWVDEAGNKGLTYKLDLENKDANLFLLFLQKKSTTLTIV